MDTGLLHTLTRCGARITVSQITERPIKRQVSLRFGKLTLVKLTVTLKHVTLRECLGSEFLPDPNFAAVSSDIKPGIAVPIAVSHEIREVDLHHAATAPGEEPIARPAPRHCRLRPCAQLFEGGNDRRE